jgi:hypothetical protein
MARKRMLRRDDLQRRQLARRDRRRDEAAVDASRQKPQGTPGHAHRSLPGRHQCDRSTAERRDGVRVGQRTPDQAFAIGGGDGRADD